MRPLPYMYIICVHTYTHTVVLYRVHRHTRTPACMHIHTHTHHRTTHSYTQLYVMLGGIYHHAKCCSQMQTYWHSITLFINNLGYYYILNFIINQPASLLGSTAISPPLHGFTRDNACLQCHRSTQARKRTQYTDQKMCVYV